MKDDYVTYEQAIILKELGFDWKCNHYYDTQTKEFLPVDWFDYDGDVDADDLYDSNPPTGIISYRVSAPTMAQVAKWLREIKNIIVNPYFDIWQNCNKYESYYYLLRDVPNPEIYMSIYEMRLVGDNFNTYEEALSAAIDEALNFLKTKEIKS